MKMTLLFQYNTDEIEEVATDSAQLTSHDSANESDDDELEMMIWWWRRWPFHKNHELRWTFIAAAIGSVNTERAIFTRFLRLRLA